MKALGPTCKGNGITGREKLAAAYSCPRPTCKRPTLPPVTHAGENNLLERKGDLKQTERSPHDDVTIYTMFRTPLATAGNIQ